MGVGGFDETDHGHPPHDEERPQGSAAGVVKRDGAHAFLVVRVAL